MKKRAMTVVGLAGVLALVACSATKRVDEGPRRSSSGSATEPNSCGTYVGDAELPEQHGGAAAVFTGHVTESSPTQNGRFGPPFTLPDNDGWTTHSCDTPNPTPTIEDLGRDVRYDEIFLENWTDSSACISVWAHDLSADVAENVQFNAYVGSFDPDRIGANNVAAGVGVGGGAPGQGAAHYAFDVPAHTPFAIVVSAEARKQAAVDVTWTVQVSNCGEPGGGGASSGDAASDGAASADGGSTSGGGGASDDAGGAGKSW